MASVLAVDDSVSMLEMVAMTLGDAGFEVVSARDGREALDVARRRDVDLVITDVNMPRMDGLTLVRELRRVPAYRYKPILVLTTESSDEMKRRGREAGATGWIVKPFCPERLVAVAGRLVG